MADPNGLYIVKADGSIWSGRRKFGGAIATPRYDVMPTATDDPNWQLVHTNGFPVDLPIGSFDFSTSGPLKSTCAAYGPYYASMAGSANGWKGSNGNGDYQPSRTLSVQNGILTCDQQSFVQGVGSGALYHPLEGTPGTNPTNEPWIKGPYRRMAHRFKADATGPGFGFVGLFISENWPDGGELDFTEGDCSNPTIEGWHHYALPKGSNPSQQQIGPAVGLSRRDWHTYDILWMPGRVVYKVDGTVLLDTTKYVGASQQKITFQGCQSGGTAPAAGVTARWEIDWVAIYDWVGAVA